MAGLASPSPLVGEGGASRSEATGEGSLTARRALQEYLLVQMRVAAKHRCSNSARLKAFRGQNAVSLSVALRVRVLTAVDLDHQTRVETNEVEDVTFERNLPSKFESGK